MYKFRKLPTKAPAKGSKAKEQISDFELSQELALLNAAPSRQMAAADLRALGIEPSIDTFRNFIEGLAA